MRPSKARARIPSYSSYSKSLGTNKDVYKDDDEESRPDEFMDWQCPAYSSKHNKIYENNLKANNFHIG